MPEKRFSVEPIIEPLREAGMLLAQGKTLGKTCRHRKGAEHESAGRQPVIREAPQDH